MSGRQGNGRNLLRARLWFRLYDEEERQSGSGKLRSVFDQGVVQQCKYISKQRANKNIEDWQFVSRAEVQVSRHINFPLRYDHISYDDIGGVVSLHTDPLLEPSATSQQLSSRTLRVRCCAQNSRAMHCGVVPLQRGTGLGRRCGGAAQTKQFE